MGTVYSARDESLGRDVAVKVLGEHLVGSAEAAARFEREARTAASFAHPHVVTIHDFGVAAGNRAFLVMEQLRGRTLREEIAAGPIAAHRALAVVADLCDVLDVAHGRALVHRDLKPENVVLAEGASPDTKVLDFGIAKALTDSAAPAGAGARTGVLVGTVPYMSPEQLRGEPVASSWDLWALAVMCQEMLTGERPAGLVPASPTEAPGAPDGPAAVVASPLTPALRAFFTRALAIDPSQRPATAASFREQFAGAVGEKVSRQP
jgi:serine/threonine-protein kinase